MTILQQTGENGLERPGTPDRVLNNSEAALGRINRRGRVASDEDNVVVRRVKVRSEVLNSLTSPSSHRSYDHAIREFIEWYCSEPRLAFNKTVVTRYRISLEQRDYASSTINLRLAAVRRLAYEAADCGLLSLHLAAGIRRVKGVKKLGVSVVTGSQQNRDGNCCWQAKVES